MVRIIQAIGITALLLAAVVLTLCVLEHREAQAPAQVTSMTVARLGRAASAAADESLTRTPPLVQQAIAFSAYLDPPAPPSVSLGPSQSVATVADPASPSRVEVAAVAEVRPSLSSPKFELHGISYYRADPSLSMAMICEPGGSRRWVRPGDKIGHVVIERIENDGLIYQDGVQLRTMALAPGEAIERFTSQAENDRQPKPSVTPVQNTPAVPPVRGLRQMPLSRVAAKLGQAPRESDLPDRDRMEAQ